MTTDRNSYSSITKAIGLFGGVKLFQILVSLIKNKLVAILLGPTGMGINGMIMSTTALISSLTNFGLQVSAVRDVSKAYTSNDEETINQTVSVLRRLVLFTGLLGTILTFIFAPWLSQWAFGDESYTNAFRLVSVVLFLDQVCIGQTVLLQGTFNYKYMAKASFWGSILGLIISIPIYYIWHFEGIVPVIILTSLANLLLSTYYSRKIPYKKQQLSIKATFKKGRVMLLLGLALASTGIMDNGKIYLLRLVIAHFGDLADVGLYTAGVAVANQYIGMVLMSMASDYSPRLAAVSDDNAAFIDAINKQMKLLVTLVTPLIIFFILFIKPITILLYSTKFIPITGMLEWMMLGMTFRSVAWCITFCYVAKGDAKFFFWNEVVSTSYSALFAVLGYILDGFEGMGVGFCLMYVLYAIQHLIISYRKYGYQVSCDVLKAIVPQVIMTCFFFLVLRCLGYSLARYVVGICGMIVISIFSLKYLNQMLNIKHLFSKFIKRKKMTDTYKSITVLVICYKQQDVIKRALDSVLCQREYGLNKIVVCDDCSPDKTWDVLQDYKSRYPEYFEIHRNEHNLGIYQNMEKLVSLRGESDLFVDLSGDDAFENGFFKAVQDYIKANNVDFSVPIGIYADYKVIYPNGNQTICRQNIVEDKSLNRFSLYIRYKLSGRSMMINDLVLQKQKPTIFDKGLNLAESFFDCQKHLIVEKGYYVPVVGDIYYGGIGISVKLADTDYYSTQAMAKWQYYLDNLITKKEDIVLAKAEIMKCQFILSPSLKGYFRCLMTYLVSGYPHKPTLKEIINFTLLMKRRVFKKYEKYWLLWVPIKVLYRL